MCSKRTKLLAKRPAPIKSTREAQTSKATIDSRNSLVPCRSARAFFEGFRKIDSRSFKSGRMPNSMLAAIETKSEKPITQALMEGRLP